MSISLTRFTKHWLTFCLLVASTFACQSFNTKKPKYYSTEITLNNGTVMKGSTSPIADDSFSFKDAQTSKKSTIQNKDVKSITKYLPDGVKEYAQVEIVSNKKQDKTKTVLGALLVKGTIDLIAYEANEYVRETKNVNNRMTFVNEKKLVKHLYLKRGNAPAVEVNMGARKAQEEDFMDTALTFFSDAPELMKKIGSTGYEAKDIKKIVEEFNTLKSSK